MSYQKSEVECGWCGKTVDDGGEVACRKCYEALEGQVGDLEKRVAELEEELAAKE